MAKYLIEYTDRDDRFTKVKEQESFGRQMLHDDFILTGGVMTFIDPIPLTQEELDALRTERLEFEALAKVDELIDQIDSLTKAKTFLKRLCQRLVQKGYLP